MWRCHECGESVDDDFEVCWNCTAARDGAAAEAAEDTDAPAESEPEQMARKPIEANPYSSPGENSGDEEFVAPLDRVYVLQHTVFLARLILGIVILLLLGAGATIYSVCRWLSRSAESDMGLLRAPLPFTWYLYYLAPPIIGGLCFFSLIFGIARFTSAIRRLLDAPEADVTAAFSALNRCLLLVIAILLVLLGVRMLVALYEVGLLG
jgi:hypothetical protein